MRFANGRAFGGKARWRPGSGASLSTQCVSRRDAAWRCSTPEAITSRNGSHADEPDARVRVALALLPERQRLTLFLRYYADLDYRTIAEMLGVTIGSVGVTLSTAQTRLRELLEEAPR